MNNKILDVKLPQNIVPEHGGHIYSSDKPYSIIDYSININSVKTPKSIKKTMQSSLSRLNKYPDITYEKAILNLAKNNNVNKNNIVLGNGMDELIYLAIQTLKPRKTMIPIPNYSEYQKACRVNGCEVIYYNLSKDEGFSLNIDNFTEKIGNGIDMIILSNPNNPTGKLIDKNSIKKLLEFCRSKGIYLIIDETYIDFCNLNNSSIGFIESFANVIILRSLCEYYSMPGIRSAYAVASESLTELILNNKYPWSINQFSTIVMEQAYNDAKFIKNTEKWLATEAKRFYNLLSLVNGVRAYETDANFILLELLNTSSAVIVAKMLKKGILIRDASNFEGLDDHFIRVAIKDKKSNDNFYDKFYRCML